MYMAKDALKRYDKDKDGKLSKSEAEPWLQDIFTGLQRQKKLNTSIKWSEYYFEEAFNKIDRNKDGKLDLTEIAKFCEAISCWPH